ncbi:hypothetical protein HUT16_16645 [Kitasatospora sp. NA04385]|uniref:HEPN domain-containing protein n=1 Tax=Kitasatospora sp. NA04385 TaxID=2742135 RepID=UPI001591268E|nr:HEPN domain-containing protein [Kitasatospora sp. NA04385]QKW20480.1 hypothetical protein HUT16_16645 [Kitasatospora sp. NA04385]
MDNLKPYKEGDLRICCILLDVIVRDESKNFIDQPQRIPLGGEMAMVRLEKDEEDRVAYSIYNRYFGGWRLEIHNVPDRPAAWLLEFSRRKISLLCCAERVAPGFSAVLDRYNGEHWERVKWLGMIKGARHSFISSSRLSAWGEICESWPSPTPDKRISVALDFFRESVYERQDRNFSNSLLLLAVAYESLLGDGLQGDLTFRLSQRGALLTSKGEPSYKVAKRLKSIYASRSRLVHNGKEPDIADITRLQQFMMRAIPSIARLSSTCSSYKGALEALDSAPFFRIPEIDDLFSPEGESGWWEKVDIPAIPGWI